jgi:hypothetical protein
MPNARQLENLPKLKTNDLFPQLQLNQKRREK